MVIDSSALIAILRDEPERTDFNRRIETDPARLMSAVSFVETTAVIETRYGLAGRHMVDAFVRRARIEIVGVDLDQAMIARDAYRSCCSKGTISLRRTWRAPDVPRPTRVRAEVQADN